MMPRNLIQDLEARLTQALARFPVDEAGWILPLPKPEKLTVRSQALAEMFEEGKPAEPPSQARINALGRLRRNSPDITRKDWRLIAWGLCDDCGKAGKPIEVADMFDRVMQYFNDEFSQGGLSRQMWFGLLHSYFAYQQEQPEQNTHWVTLRAKLEDWLPRLIQAQKRPKVWTTILEKHRELLTSQAGTTLARALFDGQSNLADEVADYLPVPDSSWLWRRVIIEQLNMLFRIPDQRFYSVISAMLGLAQRHPHQTDNVLSAVLTRYASSAARDQAHDTLKEFALSRWGNPQMKSANRWTAVADDVRKMVLQWFAKADLEHFFSLLQGEGGVDRARLNYWLRFVDQISYTRVVMGYDAYTNTDPNFVDFRKKNIGRYSELQGGKTSNNAFVMRIGDYYFVEFSETGNACYIYAAVDLPFNPDHRTMQLQGLNGLKHKPSAIERILHNGDWESKSDFLLRQLGIQPGKKVISAAKSNKSAARQWQPLPSQSSQSSVSSSRAAASTTNLVSPDEGVIPKFGADFDKENGSATNGSPSKSGRLRQKEGDASQITLSKAVRLAEKLAAVYRVKTSDHRAMGGAFWVLHLEKDSELGKQLEKWGFKFRAQRGYWIT